MTLEELKIRRLTNQHLLQPADKITVAQTLCGLQAQFLSNAVHALGIRCETLDPGTLPEGLVKNWTLRGTMHVFAEKDLPLFLHGADRENRWDRPSWWNQRADWSLSPERQGYFSSVMLRALGEKPRSREELKALCRENGMTEPEENSMFHPWGGGIRELCEKGLAHYAVREEKIFCLTPPFTTVPEEEARLILARRYFEHYGPATIHDAMYFFHAPAKAVKSWLQRLPVQEAVLDGRAYYWVENGRDFSGHMPKCLFLAGFDPLLLGYEKKESLFLQPAHLRRVFNLAGIVMPTVLLRGQIVGKWKKKNRKLEVTLFASVSLADRKGIEAKAAALWKDLESVSFVE